MIDKPQLMLQLSFDELDYLNNLLDDLEFELVQNIKKKVQRGIAFYKEEKWKQESPGFNRKVNFC